MPRALTSEDIALYTALLGAGAILTGFCGTFLSFRLQREASYYRQPVVDFKTGRSRDILIGLSHFTSSFLLLIVATLLAVVCGFILPLLALIEMPIPPRFIVAGMVSSLVFVLGYFTCEMTHYGVLNRRLLNDPNEWGRSMGTVVATLTIAALAATLVVVYGVKGI